MSNQEITLKIPREGLVQLLEKVFKEEYKESMPEVIVGVLQNNTHALETIIQATMGIVPKMKYKVGDVVSVKTYGVSSWRFDETEMETKGYTSNGHLKATIEEVSLYALDPYKVIYQYWCKDEHREKTDTYSITEQYIIGLAEEYPLEL
jgi:hypothetical protein